MILFNLKFAKRMVYSKINLQVNLELSQRNLKPLYTSVSYTHLDVYKRQPLYVLLYNVYIILDFIIN